MPFLALQGQYTTVLYGGIEGKAALVRKIIWEYFLGRFIAKAQNEVRNTFSARIAEA